jgi:hypothetical protein
LTAERGKLTEKEKDPKWAELTKQIDEQSKKKADADSQLKDLQQKETMAKALLAQATETREAIEKNYAVAMTQANAAASGFGVFSESPRLIKLNDESTQYIAKAVTDIVTTVVNQKHGEDSCFALVSSVYDRQDKDPVAKALVTGRSKATVQLEGGRQMDVDVPGPLKAAWDYCKLIFESKGTSKP